MKERGVGMLGGLRRTLEDKDVLNWLTSESPGETLVATAVALNGSAIIFGFDLR